MQQGNVLRVRTDKDTQFAASLAQDHGIQLTLTPAMVGEGLAAGRHVRGRLKAIRILSKENLAWEVWLFGNSSFATTDADTELFLGRWTFVASDGVRAIIGSTTDSYYHYYIDGLDVAIQDMESLGQLNMRLVNRSTSTKTAGANGEVVVELAIEPTQGI